MSQTVEQKRLSILYEAQDEIQKEKNPSPKKQFLIKLMINKLEKEIVDSRTKGI